MTSCGGSTPPDNRYMGGDGGADMTSGGATLNGCTDAMYVDKSAAGASRTIEFGGQGSSGAFAYSPQCILIAAGQKVSFSGVFSVHPLSPGTSPSMMSAGSPNNPIQRTSSGQMLDVTFASAGTYPYFCEFHYAAGMVGAVRVK